MAMMMPPCCWWSWWCAGRPEPGCAIFTSTRVVTEGLQVCVDCGVDKKPCPAARNPVAPPTLQ
eukprot:363537-Chlamydomonas_euryale.AAC.5